MLAAALLLAAALPAGPVADAERAFAADAQASGQWTAFRRFASQRGWMFAPQPVKAQALLAGRADPPRAIAWWPDRTTTACDGTLALSQGHAILPDGSHGRFNTIWAVEPGQGWRWLADFGSPASGPAAPGTVTETRPSCRNLARAAASEPAMPAGLPRLDGGAARDASLRWALRSDGRAHLLLVWAWDGRGWREIARKAAP